MVSNWKFGLIAGVFLAGSLFVQNQTKEYKKLKASENKSQIEILAEAENYPTTTHFAYNLLNESESNFHDVNKLEKIIKNIENKFSKKQEYSKEEVIDILKFTNKEIKDNLPKVATPCNEYSFIFKAIGEKFNIPLYLVSAPEHVFIRCDLDGKHDVLNQNNPINKGDFNWETTIAQIKSDDFYIKWRNISKTSIEKGVYMKNLTKKESLSKVYNNLGTYIDEKGDCNLAVKNYTKSIELDPNNKNAFYNRGISNLFQQKYSLAIEDFSESIKLDSNFAESYKLRGFSYKYSKDMKKAEFDFNKYEELKK